VSAPPFRERAITEFTRNLVGRLGRLLDVARPSARNREPDRRTPQESGRLRELAAALRMYPRMYALAWTAHPRYAFLSLSLTVLAGLVAPAQIWITKLVIDGITEQVGAARPGGSVAWTGVLSPIGLILAVWVVGAPCQSFGVHVRMLLGMSAERRTQELILEKAASLDLAFFETPAFCDQMDNARQQSGQAHNVTYRSIEMASGTVALVVLLGLVAHVHVLAVPVLVGTALPQAIGSGYFHSRFVHVWKSRVRLRRLSRYLGELIASRDAVKEVRVFGLDTPLLSRFRQAWRTFLQDERKYRISLSVTHSCLGLLSMVGTAAIWGYAVVQAVQGRMTLGDVALAFQSSERVRDALEQLFSRAGLLYENRLYASQLFGFLDIEPESVRGALQRVPGPATGPTTLRHGIEFRHVNFSYPGTPAQVLRDVSFFLPVGDSLALVGENGAGKTTLIKLLARLYAPLGARYWSTGAT